MKAGARKPANLPKVREVIQDLQKSPFGFLCEVPQLFTPTDPDTPENQQVNNIAFVVQSATDIKKELQKLEGLRV